jgi:hypothetical protein
VRHLYQLLFNGLYVLIIENGRFNQFTYGLF